MSASCPPLRHQDHLCSFYNDAREQLALAAPFLAEGLSRGEACLYVADDRSTLEVTRALARLGVDTADATRRRALVFVS